MYMNNEALQAFLAEFGDRVCIITFDDYGKILLDYAAGVGTATCKVSDIIFRTFNGVDMFAVPGYPNNPKEREQGVKHQIWHPTYHIKSIVLIDEDHKHLRVDPAQY